jgi:hypothetical protein
VVTSNQTLVSAQVDEGIEHGLEPGEAHAMVKVLGERLEIDVGGIHGPEKLRGPPR